MEILSSLARKSDTKMVLLVMDGLGGLPREETGLTELETAKTPNLDRLASQSSCGQMHPIAPGITAGSGPAHLALFGYDPLGHNIGRGVLSALGLDLDLGPDDVACRVNFATMRDGKIVDRRAGRIPTEECARLCKVLSGIKMGGVEITVAPEMQHRAAVVFRGRGLSGAVTDSDPQKEGLAPLTMQPLNPESKQMADIANAFVEEAKRALKDEPVANMVLMRGFDKSPAIATVSELYGIRAAAIAAYPMYRGLAKLVGMNVITGVNTLEEEVEALSRCLAEYDYFFVHVKYTDSSGEDGDFDRKVSVIEEVDALIPSILDLRPDVFVVTGDHSTPARLKSHSWHPVPVLLHASTARCDAWLTSFGEGQCARGSLGTFESRHLMALMLAHAQRLAKFGA
jgi:2,3-bisphosphoglycerate-independent phosphoglycerate mutase